MEYDVRPATPADLDAVVAFEIEIALVSFGDDAVTDPAVHRRKLAKALERDAASMLVACSRSGDVVGWLWLSLNQNFLTGDPYANFRSLAVAPVPGRDDIADALLGHALRHAASHGVTEVTGKVHVANTGMRLVYKRHGFEPVHLTMRYRAPS
ncbi:MAG TPA: GNAT family N-acetyltransferase [Pseudonocardiaceae bacterium]